jgi:hypothetical protein
MKGRGFKRPYLVRTLELTRIVGGLGYHCHCIEVENLFGGICI